MRDYALCDECRGFMIDQKVCYVKTEGGFLRVDPDCKKKIEDRGEAIECLPIVLMGNANAS